MNYSWATFQAGNGLATTTFQVCFVCCYYRLPHKVICANHTLLGNPACGRRFMGSPERQLLEQQFPNALPDDCTFWSKLLLKTSGRVICGQNRSRATKRNNSAIVYTDGTGSNSYGLLQDIMLYSAIDGEHCFATVQPLVKSTFRFYKDPLTGCRLSDHFIAFFPPRLAEKADRCYYYVFFWL